MEFGWQNGREIDRPVGPNEVPHAFRQGLAHLDPHLLARLGVGQPGRTQDPSGQCRPVEPGRDGGVDTKVAQSHPPRRLSR